MLSRMDAAQALADLTEISSQVKQVGIFDSDRVLVASTIAEADDRARFTARLERFLVEVEAHEAELGQPFSQLEASTIEGSVFIVRSQGRMIVATTRPDPTVGLVLYDLKRCLQSLDEPPHARPPAAKPRTRAPRKKADNAA